MNALKPFFWMNTINFFATSIALYGLWIFYFAIRQDIREFHPITKFLSVKFIIFLTFWQSLAIDLFDHFGWLPESGVSGLHLTAITFQSLLLCFEVRDRECLYNNVHNASLDVFGVTLAHVSKVLWISGVCGGGRGD